MNANEQAYQDNDDLRELMNLGISRVDALEMLKEKRMTLNDYQKFTDTTKTFPEKHAIIYPTLGLAEEAGEVAGKIKKWLRGDTDTLDKEQVKKEMGDVLWYLASLATDLGFTLEDVAVTNMEKLLKRKATGTLKGNGDDRELDKNVVLPRDIPEGADLSHIGKNTTSYIL